MNGVSVRSTAEGDNVLGSLMDVLRDNIGKRPAVMGTLDSPASESEYYSIVGIGGKEHTTERRTSSR